MICNALQWYHAQNYINLPISYEAKICGETSRQQNIVIPTCHFAFTMCQETKTQDTIHDKFAAECKKVP